MKTISLIIALLFHADIGSIWQRGTPHVIVVLAAIAISILLGLAIVMSALRNAQEGYEDEEGFHSTRSHRPTRHSHGLGVLRPHNAG
jgi:hypothetical protein